MADNLLTLTFPVELSARIRARMEESDGFTAEQVIEEALNALDHTAGWPTEAWELAEIDAALEESDRDPSSVRTPEQVRDKLQAEYERALERERSTLAKAG